MSSLSPAILIIVGITGDLSRRYLLPAIAEMRRLNEIPSRFHILGITRRSGVAVAELINHLDGRDYLEQHIEMFQMDLTATEDYVRLGQRLAEIEKKLGQNTQKLFYLSVPPEVSYSIIEQIGLSGLAESPQVKLLVEKPFGTDMTSAKQMIDHITDQFSNDQVYFIDHYLAKAMVIRFLKLRSENEALRQLWNNQTIESIEIIASESIDIEGRANFYEQTGALRDVVQSHLLELAALTIMDLPRDQADIPVHRLRALQGLRISSEDDAIRGQYLGYRDEVNNPKSIIETFAHLRLQSNDPHWKNVKINLISGKALAERTVEIRILFEPGSNYHQFILRIQPREGFELTLRNSATESAPHNDELQSLNQSYHTNQGAYATILTAALTSRRDLFITSNEVVETWRIIEPVLTVWEKQGNDLIFYQKGSDLNSLYLS